MTRRTATTLALCFGLAAALAGCGDTPIGRPPEMTTIGEFDPNAQPLVTAERMALAVPPPQAASYSYQQGSLWNTGPSGLLGDRRARNLGDLLTVVIEIDEEAEMRNTSTRSREGSEQVSAGAFLGIQNVLPSEITSKLTPSVEIGSESDFRGQGTVRRNEKLTLRVAATVVRVLPNSHLVIQGDQEVRVNSELRDLQVVGIVRPEDISRYNEIQYDRVAGARISYGGRGQITNVQQPRWGQQVTDRVLPF